MRMLKWKKNEFRPSGRRFFDIVKRVCPTLEGAVRYQSSGVSRKTEN
jgi:hypothetical protein